MEDAHVSSLEENIKKETTDWTGVFHSCIVFYNGFQGDCVLFDKDFL